MKWGVFTLYSDNIIGIIYRKIKKDLNRIDIKNIGCSFSEYLDFFDAFFDKLSSDFNNLSIDKISVGLYALSGNNLEILRTKYGLYNDGVFQTNSIIAKEFNVSEQFIDDIEKKLIFGVKKNYNECILNSIHEFHELTNRCELRAQGKVLIKHTALNKISHLLRPYEIKTIFDLLCCNKNDLILRLGFSKCESDNIINYIHDLGLKFKDEVIDEKEFNDQNTYLLSKDIKEIIEEHGSPSFSCVDISSLKLGLRITKKLMNANIKVIDDLIKLPKEKVLSLVKVPEQRDKIVDKVHEMGYKFSDEVDEIILKLLEREDLSENSSKIHNLIVCYKNKVALKDQKAEEIRNLQLELNSLDFEISKVLSEINDYANSPDTRKRLAKKNVYNK